MHCISEQGIVLLKRFEGFSAKPYLCPAGKWTIGYGHVIGAGEKFPPGGLTEEEANQLLKQDVKMTENALNQLIKVDISQNQHDALVSLVYNIGIQAFEKSTLLKFLNQNNLEMAARQFGRWVYAGGEKMEGLIRRRSAEYLIFSAET